MKSHRCLDVLYAHLDPHIRDRYVEADKEAVHVAYCNDA